MRRSLRVSVAEGLFAEVTGACAGGAVLTGWALFLGASPLVVGLVGALPQLAQLVQLPAAWCTTRFGHRPVALWAVGASRQVLLLLALLPCLPVAPTLLQVLLVGIAGLSSLLGVVGNNGWVAWMGELVPASVRGRYFGRRNALCTLGGTLASLGAGVFLDEAHARASAGRALVGLSVLASLSGALTTWLMLQQHDPRPAPERTPRPVPFQLRAFGIAFQDAQSRPFLRYQLGWNAAVGISGSYFALYMLQHLGLGFTGMAAHAAGGALVRTLTAPLWGRALDRVGARPVLVACSFGIALIPLLWLFPAPDRLWPVVVDAILTGVLWGGHAVALFALPLAVAPATSFERPYYFAAFSATAGLAFAGATALGGWLAEALPDVLTFGSSTLGGSSLVDLQVLFVLSALGRLGAAFTALAILEPGSQPVGHLLRELSRHMSRPLPSSPPTLGPRV